MDSKKVIETLFKVAQKQQKIIEKLAQQLPNSEITTFTPGAHTAPVGALPPQHLAPNVSDKRPAQLILRALDPRVVALLTGSQVEVHQNSVHVFVKPGQSDKTLDAVQKHVSNTVNKVLPAGQYNVSVQEVV